ncbi:YbaB/EbfC family nucleoid-associated protein [Nocardia cyriacigeorgica]|uniref:YbaB/EbfC family nucleoid-associated protein n=1 Tax=Nocardia cyriacigeorgica TaxID=135487 RepID=UPI001895D8CE|nr:YbaB/EbfC family nucleoid-associated protein [Nocardia cyriacigeorgica]MBF6514020.1 YbaB/EbfC family nucleoid-associated protein [Nocardia cyriacigeorgica]
MTSAHLDPMSQNTQRLVQSLTTARSRAQSPDGLLIVEMCADGQLTVKIDDRALAYGGAAISAELNRLAAQALTEARAEVADAVDAFCADPRIANVIDATHDAMAQPPVDVRPAASSPQVHESTPPADVNAGFPPPARRQGETYVTPIDDPYLDDDYDPYYHRKSWLVD